MVSMETEEIVWLHPDAIQVTPGVNPRRHADPEGLQQLAESIRLHGILKPLVVRPLPDGGYELVCGSRRLAAARMVGLDRVPVRVVQVDEKEAAELRLIENLQREDLDPIEEAEAYRQLCALWGYTYEELARRLGISKAQVAERIRLLDLPLEVQEYLVRRQLGPSAGEILLRLQGHPEVQVDLARRAAQHQWSLRELEVRVHSALTWLSAQRTATEAMAKQPQPESAAEDRPEREREWEREAQSRLRWEAVVRAAVDHLAPGGESRALWAVLAGIAVLEANEKYLRRLYRLAGLNPYASPLEVPRAIQALARGSVPVPELRRLAVEALLSDRYWGPVVTEVLYEALPDHARERVDQHERRAGY